MLDPKTVSLTIFIISYILFVCLPNRRTHIAVLGTAILISLGIMSLSEIYTVVNWDVMGIFLGTLIVADIFIESRVPAYLAEIIIDRSKNTTWAMLCMCIMTSFISAFVENVATVLIMAPIALSLTKKLNINPTKLLIAIAVASNLQGTATLIGDPPSMLLGGFAHMNFMDFFFYKGKPSIFFAVEIGAFFSFFILYILFKKYKSKQRLLSIEKVTSWVPTIILIALIFLLAISSTFQEKFHIGTGLICMVMGLISICWKCLKYKKKMIGSIINLDWETTIFLICIFILVGSLNVTGWIETLSTSLSSLMGNNIFLGYTLIVFGSVILSAFIDNVPFLVVMLPVVINMADKLQINPSLFLFGLLIGASLGGNITPIGASANIVSCGILKREGYEVSFKEFLKIGLPFTMVAVVSAYLFIWIVWKGTI